MAFRVAHTSKTCVKNLIPIILSDTFADALDVDANDPRYLPGDEEEHFRGMRTSRKPNVQFLEANFKGTNVDSLRSNKLVTLVAALRNITAGEELFVQYGTHFRHWTTPGTATRTNPGPSTAVENPLGTGDKEQ